MSHFRNGHLIESLAEGGYLQAEPIDEGEYIVYDDDEGGTFEIFQQDWILTDNEERRELWSVNPGHAGYTIVLPTGEELEFARSM